MGEQKMVLIKTHFVFISRKMGVLIKVLWLSLFTSLSTLFSFIGRHIVRLQGKMIGQQEWYSPEFVTEKGEDEDEDEEESKSLLRFRFPTFEEFVVKNDVYLVNYRIFCDNSDVKCSFIESKIDTLSSINSIVSKRVEDVVEPRISSEIDMIVNPCIGFVEPPISSENNIIVNHVKEIVEPGICSGNPGKMTVELIGEIVERRISSELNLIANPANELTERQICIENPSEVIGKLIEEIVEPQISSESSSLLRDVSGSFLNLEIEDCRRKFISVPKDCKDEISKTIEIVNRRESSQMVDKLGNNLYNVRHNAQFLSGDESLESDSDSDSDSDSMVSSNSSLRVSFIDSISDELLSDIDFPRAFEIDSFMEYGWKEVKLSSDVLTEEHIDLQYLSKDYDSDDFKDEDKDIQELKFIEMECRDSENVNVSFDSRDGMNVRSELLSDQSVAYVVDFKNNSDIREVMNMESGLIGLQQNLELNFADGGEDETKIYDELESKQDSEKSSSGEQLSSDSEEQNGLEREWEHQDLVEQLKMEIKNVRAIGLPTILEESESPKIVDDFKPWKIEQKYQPEGTMDELHKFYKSYRERMRKLDILNFQKMYAIGFLRQKDPLQSFTKNRMSIPALAAIVSLNCWPCKPKSSSEIHPPLMKKFTRELESDLEMVYVSQMCLSWEFLCWEYGKALDIWESDLHGMRCYNEVANKFQMFQVLVTRFLENEPFQGPRVQHYVKDRCMLRNLLQVPVIQDDNYRDRKKERKVLSSKDDITSLQLVEIIEESIRVLWQFIRTDKDSSNTTLLNYRRSPNVEFQTPADASLYAEVRSTLEKKEKKLKELTRSENCILRNFRKHPQEDGSENVLYFFSRVDMKLVSRVLNMSRISTEQLVWCSDKLNKINIVGRQLQVEPSILLFPCS